MTTLPLLSRRYLLTTLTTLTALGLTKAGLKLVQPASEVPEPLMSLLDLLKPCRKSAAIIGKRYLMLTPEEDDRQILLRRLLAEISISEFHESDTAGLCSEIKSRISRDFSSGRTVLIDGWVISRTEARLCAYLSAVV